HRSHTAHPRSAALAGARGEAVLAVPAGAILDVAVLDRAATALAAHPGIDGLRTLAPGPDGHLRTAPPSDAGLALVRGSCPDAPLLVRTTALRKLGLDPDLGPYAERGLALGAAAAGLRLEDWPHLLVTALPPETTDPCLPSNWQEHRARLALLAERHIHHLPLDEQRALTALLVREFGMSAFRSPLGEATHRLDAILGRRFPRLASLLRSLALRMLEAHGRAKDRAAGRG
ncbi:MAG: hypothetical protein ACO4CZ_07250, partial [Planctomycetota bacterium]